MKTLFAALLLTACCAARTPRMPLQSHDVGETLQHFIASEHVTQRCAGTALGHPEKGVCELTPFDYGAYTFRDGVLVSIDTGNPDTSFETAVQDVTARYGKPPSAQSSCFLSNYGNGWLVYQAFWELPNAWVYVFKMSRGGVVIRVYSPAEAHRLRGDDKHTKF